MRDTPISETRSGRPVPPPVAPGVVPAIEAEGLTRVFGTVTALDGVSLNVAAGEFFSLLGPSGCGKTTLLRLIAGLDLPDQGRLRIAGQDAGHWPAHRRPVNTVFQSYALFPHMDVWSNVAFGLRMKRVPAPELRARVERVLALVQVSDLARRRPAELSGGQRQRVALARALVNEPAVLLLDEPLGALDLQLRRQLQVELRALQRRLGLTFLYVTHDQEEALTMSDRVAVMQGGRIVQLGEPASLYERPRCRFVAGFLGECNLIPVRPSPMYDAVRGRVFETSLGPLAVSQNGVGEPASAAEARTLAIRPERLRLLPSGSTPGRNRVPTTVRDIAYSGSDTAYTLEAGGEGLRARVLNQGNSRDDFRPGQSLVVELPAEALVVLED